MALHPQVIEMMNKVAALGLPALTEITPEQARINSDLSRDVVPVLKEEVGSVEDTTVPGPAGQIPIRIYRPANDGVHPLIMLYHGGGWVVGDLETEDATCRGLCNRVGAVVISVEPART